MFVHRPLYIAGKLAFVVQKIVRNYLPEMHAIKTRPNIHNFFCLLETKIGQASFVQNF